jgi:hypothetical protein
MPSSAFTRCYALLANDHGRQCAVGKRSNRPRRLFRQRRRRSQSVAERGNSRDVWPHSTARNKYRYYYHPKHHGGGGPTDSRWCPDVSQQEEFTIFELADTLDLSDERNNLFNVRKSDDGKIHELGVFHEQIARFWGPSGNDLWHGHPLWPVVTESAINRSGQEYRPSRVVFQKFVARGVLSERDSCRLNSGRNI